MAEALFNRDPPPGWRAGSAGTAPASQVRPQAVAVMREVGIDISAARPKHLREALGPDVALVVGLCAEEACPVVPGARSEHWPLRDPAGSPDLQVYRDLRDELARRIAELRARLRGMSGHSGARGGGGASGGNGEPDGSGAPGAGDEPGGSGEPGACPGGGSSER